MVTTELRVAHIPLQFSDPHVHREHDIKKIFERAERRGTLWLTGTEAGEADTATLLHKWATAHGYRIHIWESVWVAVRRDFVEGNWRTGQRKVHPGGRDHGPRGIAWVKFASPIGPICVGAGHYLTRDRGIVEFSNAIGAWARYHGKGKTLVFYGGDQNINDKERDTFLGEPLTSIQDELRQWANTGHGPIDVIASYDEDKRVRGLSVRTLTDTEFFLHGDHFLIEAVYEVRISKAVKLRLETALA